MNWLLPTFLHRLITSSLGRCVLAWVFALLFAVGLANNRAHATSPSPSEIAKEIYEQDISGPLQERIQNDPVLNPQQPELKVPEAKPEPAPQPEDETATKVTVQEFVVEGNVLATTQEIQEILKPWLNTPISLNELRRGAAQVAALYRNKGYLGQAVLPNQDITEGLVRVVVVEGKVGKIILDPALNQRQIGLTAISRIQTLFESTLAQGQPLKFNEYDWANLVANELPGVSVKVGLQGGVEPGTTDVLISLQPNDLFLGAATFDNQGSRNTGEYRVSAQMQLNSYLGGGEQVSASLSKTEGSEFLRLAAKLPVALPNWRGLSFELSQSQLNYKVLRSMWGEDAQIAPQGQSNTKGFSFSYPWIRSATANLTLSLEREFRDSEDKDDNLSLNRGTLTVSRATKACVDQLTFASNFTDEWMGGGSSMVNLSLYNGYVNLLAHPDLVEQDAATLNSSGPFNKQRLSVSRLQYLGPRNSLFVSATSQWANRNLDSSEKMFLGGPNGVRAYPVSEVGGAEGLLASVEFRHDLNDRWQFGAFYDYGRVNQLVNTLSPEGDPLIADEDSNRHVIKGRGLFASYRHTNGMQFKLTVARRLGENPLKNEETGLDRDGTLRMNRWWFSASMPF